MHPRLSICIATLNRAKFLPGTLDSILRQLTDSVEVVVVDGASTDNTAEVLADYAARDSRLRYQRLAAKGGVDLDYCRAVDLARGDFCWLFSDDDILEPGAIEAVLTGLAQDVSLLIVNAQVRDRTLKTVIEERRLERSSDQRFEATHLAELFQAVVGYISFIGCVVIDRKLWQERPKDAYLGSEFIHVGVIFQQPLPRAAMVISHPYIVIRYSNSQWTARSFEIWMFKWPRVLWSFACLPQDVRERAVSREPWRHLTRLVGARANGTYSIEAYRRFLAEQEASPVWRVAAQAVAYVPPRVWARAAYWFLRFRGVSGVRLYNARARLETARSR
jgi:abequosyltransferase